MTVSRSATYLLALVLTIMAAGTRGLLSHWLGYDLPYITFFAAIVVAAWYGGLWPGLMTVGLSVAASFALFIAPRGTLGPGDAIGVLLFIGIGSIVSWSSERLHAARRLIERQNEALALEVDARVRAAEIQRLETERLGTTLQAIGDGVIVTGPDGRITSVNPVAERLTGWSHATAVEQPIGKVFHTVHELTDAPLPSPVRQSLESGAAVDGASHVVLVARDHTRRPIIVRAAPIHAADGAVVGSVLVFQELTERRRADSARAMLAAVVESSEDAIFTKSLEGQVLTWNAGAQQMFGYTAAEAVGAPVTRIVPPHRRGEEADILRRVSLGERVLPFETERVARDGTILDVSVTLSPIRDDSGRIVGASSIARDISARKSFETTLRDADRRKDEFLALLAHELRNPLAPIRNSVAVLRHGGATSPIARNAADVIERQTRHMARLLDDLLDVSRITRDRLELRREAVTLAEVIEAAVETVRPQIESHRQTLSITLPGAPVTLDGDPVRLSQVFSNLLSNASKYSQVGGAIGLSATASGGTVEVQVRDDGIGIEAEMLPRVFDMFSQSTQTVNRAQGGLGIGLALVRGLVELHGGRVTAESAGVGLGSRFTISLPISPPVRLPATASADAPGQSPSGRILVVDDNRDAADSLALLLEVQGHVVRAVYDGRSAVEMAPNFRPQIVLLDLGMPGLDGFETARRLRATLPDAAPYLVAITGWGQDRERRQATAAGFDQHLVKPVDPAELTRVLSAVIA